MVMFVFCKRFTNHLDNYADKFDEKFASALKYLG